MVLILFILTITVTHGLADYYDLYAPDDYLNYNRNDDINHDYYREDIATDVKGEEIKYNEILSLLHNEQSNKELLAKISNHNKEKLNDKISTTEKVTMAFVSNGAPPKNYVFKDDTRQGKDWDRLKRDNVNDTENATAAVPKDVKAHLNMFKSGHDVKSDIANDNIDILKHIPIASNTLKIEKEFNTIVESGLNTSRLKRHTALQMLKNLFHHSTTSTTTTEPKPYLVQPLSVRQSKGLSIDSKVLDLVENLTATVKSLNKQLASVKLQVNDNSGFVMIKVPLSGKEGRRYMEDIKEDIKNLTSKIDRVRSKRDVTGLNSVKPSKNNAPETSTMNFNVTKNDNSIIERKENDGPTIISDSEFVSTQNEFNKSKRNANFTISDNSKISINDTQVNSTEKSISFNNFSRSNTIDQVGTKIKRNESNNSESVAEPEISNTKSVTREDARKYLGSQDDLLLFIEKAYNEIKELIAPVNFMKKKYSNELLYKIGYIVANLDTMDVTLKKLKNKLFATESDTRKLQNVYRKLTMSKKLVQNIMDYLNKFAVNQPVIEA